MKISNITGISLPLAVWLVEDTYDYSTTRKTISATSLLKPVRQFILSERVTHDVALTKDVSDFIASKLGTSIHDGIEVAWRRNYQSSLSKLGYPESLIKRVVINPTAEELEDMAGQGVQPVPVYLEQRFSKDFMGYTITGKFDMVLDGELQDIKSTSTFTYIKGTKDDDYILQGSIYRWLNQDKITSDYINIQFVFTDWMKGRANADPNYPQTRVLEHRLKLLSIAEIEGWMRRKVKLFEAAADLDESEIPHCDAKELWMDAPIYKYFSDPNKIDGRSTKNFADLAEASAFCAEKGKGIVITVPGKPKACGYCAAFPICTQKDAYDHD